MTFKKTLLKTWDTTRERQNAQTVPEAATMFLFSGFPPIFSSILKQPSKMWEVKGKTTVVTATSTHKLFPSLCSCVMFHSQTFYPVGILADTFIILCKASLTN